MSERILQCDCGGNVFHIVKQCDVEEVECFSCGKKGCLCRVSAK